jgi:hypothetical protein
MIAARGALPAALVAIAALTLAGCSSMRGGPTNQAMAQPEQLQPVQQSTVAQTALPPIGQPANTQTAASPAPLQPGMIDPSLTGTPGTNIRPDPNDPNALGQPMQTASTDGGFVTLDSVGAVPTQPGRDLTGGLTVSKLLGGWTITSGADQCRLNLTQTTKSGTQRFRASAPGCSLQRLAQVSSWQLAGNQVQLFDENGDMVAAMILSGNRFIGTLAGGQGISMVG